jgi:hypothetical protein
MPRGSKPGERRGGRQSGTPNKATSTLKEFAGQFTHEAVNGLVAIARDSEMPPQARVSAWREVLDRAVGKAPQALTDADGGKLSVPAAIAFVVSQQVGSENQT